MDAIFFSSLLAPYAEVPAVEAVYDALTENAMVGVAGVSAVLALILTTVFMSHVHGGQGGGREGGGQGQGRRGQEEGRRPRRTTTRREDDGRGRQPDPA